MTNNDDLALKEDWRDDFEKIFPMPAGMQRNPPRKDGGIAGYISKNCFSGLAITYINRWDGYKAARESLLAERDADKKRIEMLEREKETMTAAALAMRDDMRDARSLLEARTVSVKLPVVPRQYETLKLCLEPSDGYGMQKGAEYMRDEIIKVLAAAGINLEVGK